jgi:hypothetical protein
MRLAEKLDWKGLNMGQIGCPETSASKYRLHYVKSQKSQDLGDGFPVSDYSRKVCSSCDVFFLGGE